MNLYRKSFVVADCFSDQCLLRRVDLFDEKDKVP